MNSDTSRVLESPIYFYEMAKSIIDGEKYNATDLHEFFATQLYQAETSFVPLLESSDTDSAKLVELVSEAS